VCGTDYLRAVGPGPAGKPNPDWTRADQAKGHRFVLLTAAGDPNLEEIRATERAYASDGFQNARLVVAEQGGHAMPPPQIFAGALDRLEGR